ATDLISGRLEIYINENEPAVRQRFSLLHELKHALDWENRAVLHATLGGGNEATKKIMVEAIANDFAAHVLMPTALVKSAWFQCQNITLMAAAFNVSLEAMTRRLENLGLSGTPKPAPRAYFRRSVSLLAEMANQESVPFVTDELSTVAAANKH